MRPHRRCLPFGMAVALAVLATGCAEMVYAPTRSYDEVVGSSRRLVASSDVDAKAWQSRTELRVAAEWRCDLVEWNDVRRVTLEEPDSDPTGDYVLLGLSAIPTGFGVALLADSGNVYEADRNSREYNPVGPSGAVAGGVVLLTIGALVAIVPTVGLVRSATSRETQQLLEEQGATLRRSLPCRQPTPATDVAIYGRLSNERRSVAETERPAPIRLGTTDAQGRLTVDLAFVLPPELLEGADPDDVLEILVGKASVGRASLLDVRLVQREQLREQDEDAWRSADPDGCRRNPSEQSCAAVRAYLDRFPAGAHAAHARDALRELFSATLAIADDVPLDDDALDRARAALKPACIKACVQVCEQRADCIAFCVEELCP